MAVTCTPQALQTGATCIAAAFTAKQTEAIQTYLLTQILLALDPSADVTVQGLATASRCFFDLGWQWNEPIQTYLLCLIAGGTGSGGVTDYNIIRDSPTLPTEPPPPDVLSIWSLTFRSGDPGLTWDPENGDWF